MIRENQKTLNKLQVIMDMTIVVISFLLSYYFRFYILDGSISIMFKESLKLILISLPIYLISYNIFDLYSAKRTKKIYIEILSIIKSNILGVLILILGLYLFKIINFSRLVLGLFTIFNIFITISSRIILRYILRKYRINGLNQKHCLIIGATKTAKELIEKINKNNHWGYNVAGIIDNNLDIGSSYYNKKIIGKFNDLGKFLNNTHIDIVFIAIDAKDFVDIGYLIKECEKAGVKTNIIPYYQKYVPAKPYIEDLDGLSIVDTRHVPLDNYFKQFIKRIFDIIVSLCAIIILSPIMILSVIMIKLTSPGPIIYKQERVGLNRRKFYMYKFFR